MTTSLEPLPTAQEGAAAFYDATAGPAWRLALALHGCPDRAARCLRAAYRTVLTDEPPSPALRRSTWLLCEVRASARRVKTS